MAATVVAATATSAWRRATSDRSGSSGGAVVWVGGLVHLVGFALLWRRAGGPAAEPLGVRVLARFSAVAIAANASASA